MIGDTHQQHFRAKELFLQVIEEKSQAEADAFLRENCGDDLELLRHVGELVRAHHSSDTLLDLVDRTSVDGTAQALNSGQKIGPYVIRHLIGEGGMGLVFLANQQDPIEREVALKVIKPGLDTREVLERFRLEQRSLARLQHPNIASVLDAGQTETGQSYFVMELVPGDSMTRFCDGERLGIRERLQLFQRVCSAVTHAHQRGIIHRDLKPSNILVARDKGEITLKVIDFGLVKAMTDSQQDEKRLTQIQRIIGTPRYMSPEQSIRGGGAVDTRSDIYSLGVILHQLLVGKTPLDCDRSASSRNKPNDQAVSVRALQRPSRSFASFLLEEQNQVANLRSLSAAQLERLLQRELDWVVLKALEFDPDRRYESAAAFSDDIDRFLAGDAIVARAPTMTYKVRKFARRHQGLLAATCFVLIALLSGLAVAVGQRHQAVQARVTAENTLEEVRVQKLKTEMLLYSADIRLAARALQVNDVYQTIQLLERHRPERSSANGPGLEWSYLMRRARGTPLSFPVSNRPLYTVCMTPDREHVVTAGAAGKIYFLNAGTMELEHSFESGQKEVNGLSFSQDGKTLVSAGDDGTIRLWNIAAFKLLQTVRFGEEKAFQAMMDPTGKYLIACGHATDIRVFSLDNGKQIRSMDAHDRTVEQIVLYPDGRTVRAVSSDGRASRWNWQTGQQISLRFPEKSRLSCIDLSADGRYCVIASIRGQVSVMGRNSGTVQLSDGIQGIAISPDSRFVALATRVGTVIKLDLEQLTGLGEFPEQPVVKKLHTGRAYDVCWVDEDNVVSVGDDGQARRTNVSSESPLHGEIPDVQAEAVAVSPDGNLVAWAKGEKYGVYDLRHDQPIPLADLPNGMICTTVAFSPDGVSLLVGADAQLMRVAVTASEQPTAIPLGEPIRLSTLRFSADAKRLLVVSRPDQQVVVYDYPQFKERFRYRATATPHGSLSSDGRHLAISQGRDLFVFDLDVGVRVAESLHHHAETIGDVRMVTEHGEVVTVGEDRAV